MRETAGLPRSVAEGVSTAPELVAGDRAAIAPVSSGQRRLWFEHQMHMGRDSDLAALASYSLHRVDPSVDPDRLRRALEALVTRHAVLRTVFVEKDGEPYQRIVPEARLDFAVVRLAWSDETARKRQRDEDVLDTLRRPYDLSRDPVLRVRLYLGSGSDTTLLLALHHIASDAWSLEVLARELADLYAEDNPPATVRELALQYSDYASWQRAQLDGGHLRSQLDFWIRELTDAPAVMAIPGMRGLTAARSTRGAGTAVELPTSVLDAVGRLSRELRATEANLLMAAFYVIVARCCGSPDVIIATPFANRTRPELEALIGFFVNVLPVRLMVDERKSFGEVSAALRNKLFEVFEHQEVPFEKLVEEVGPGRDLTHSAIAQIAFSYLASDGMGVRHRDGFVGERITVDGVQPALYDLALIVERSEASATVEVRYALDLYDETTAARLLADYVALLSRAVEEPHRPLHTLNPTPATTAPAARPSPSLDRSIAGAIRDSLRDRGDQPAIWSAHTSLTGNELMAWSDAVAAAVRARGLGGEAVVGVRVHRGPELVAALLGIMLAGAVYLPVPPEYPDERVEWMLNDAGARLLIVGDGTSGTGFRPTLDLRPLLDSAQRQHTAITAPVHPDQACYLIYTSGTTGTPKAVVVTQGGLANLVRWNAGFFNLGSEDVVTQMSSAGFDASLWEILPALLARSHLVIVPDDVRLDPGALWRLLAARGATVTLMTTPVLTTALEDMPPTHDSLRCIQTGGDRLPAVPRGLPCRLANVYGPTESTIVAAAGFVSDEGRPHIGTPITNVRAYVLDGWLRSVKDGLVGELYIAGAGVARGYHGRPGWTARRFVPDVIAGDGSRMYATGDRARWSPAGALDCLGRVDEQVKIRGVRVEPAEIAAVLASLDMVTGSVVMSRDDERRGMELVAYCTCREPTTAAQLRAAAESRLPKYMVPSEFVLVERFPQTANGKIDRGVLRSLGSETLRTESRPLQGPLEGLVAQIWTEVLGIEVIDPNDDFFRLGGHSLLASRTAGRLSVAAGVPVSVRTVFERPVLRDLAQWLEARILEACAALDDSGSPS